MADSEVPEEWYEQGLKAGRKSERQRILDLIDDYIKACQKEIRRLNKNPDDVEEPETVATVQAIFKSKLEELREQIKGDLEQKNAEGDVSE